MEEEKKSVIVDLKAKVRIAPINTDSDSHAKGTILTTEELDARKQHHLWKSEQTCRDKRPLTEDNPDKPEEPGVLLLYNTRTQEPDSVSSQKYKTLRCKYHPGCSYTDCRFAHGDAELAHFLDAQFCLKEYYQRAKDSELQHAEYCSNQLCPVRLRLLLRKTVMCKFWERGKCRRSTQSCDWAHGEDLRALPKREMCQKNQKKKCNLEPTECVYAHSSKELRCAKGKPVKIRASEQQSELSGGNSDSDDTASKHYHGHRICQKQNCNETRRILLKKTQMCWHWKDGSCPRGSESCNFAHGDDDLRPLPKYELCEMHLEGNCYWSASQCVFAHDPSELRSSGAKASEIEDNNVKDCEEDSEMERLCVGCRDLKRSLPSELAPRYFNMSRKTSYVPKAEMSFYEFMEENNC